MMSRPPPLTRGVECNCISQTACAQNAQTQNSVFLPLVCVRTFHVAFWASVSCVWVKVSTKRAMESEQIRADGRFLSQV